jgi:hypothetical protein
MAHTVGCAALFVELTRNAERVSDKSEPRFSRVLHKISRAGHVTSQFLKTMALDDDAGVGWHMNELRRLVEEEGKLSTALILASVLKIQKDVLAVHGSVDTVSNKLDVLHSLIGEYSHSLSPTRIDQLKTYFSIENQPWNDTARTYAERHVGGTGVWLPQHELFINWDTTRADTSQFLAIEAGSMFGKTHLATMAATYLAERARCTEAHCVVASYYLDKTSKTLTAAAIVRAIAFQLCVQDPPFLETAYPLIRKAAGLNKSLSALSTSELWSSLVVDVITSLPNCSCFVVLDGLELLAEEQLDVLAEALAQSNRAHCDLRILLAGNAGSLSTITHRAGHSVPRIVLDGTFTNQQDVTLVTDKELARCDLFLNGASNPELQEFRSSIRERLVKAVRGDYFLLRSRIRDIRHLLSTSEIQRVLSRAGEDREVSIKRNLADLAVRLSKEELDDLKDILHFLAVLGKLRVPMPHPSVLELYLVKAEVSSEQKSKLQPAYFELLSVEKHGQISLATDAIASYLLPDLSTNLKDGMETQPPLDKQLAAIKLFLDATFSPEALKEHGIDDNFYQSRTRLQSVSTFIMDRNAAMAMVAIRLVDCLATISTAPSRQSDTAKKQNQGLVALAGRVLPEILVTIDISTLNPTVRNVLAVEVGRLLLDSAVLDVFWPVTALSELRTTWGENSRYFEAAFHLLKHPAVTEHVKRQQDSYPWLRNVQDMSAAGNLKLAISRLIAKRWLFGKSFWGYDEIKAFYHWFTTVPELNLIKKDVEDANYDKFRTKDWFTPPNWEEIEAWIVANVKGGDSTNLDIQRAAVLCAFGDQTDTPEKLLEPHRHSDWRAQAWYGEAMSYKVEDGDYSTSLAAVEQCLDMLEKCYVDQEDLVKVNDFFLVCVPEWGNAQRDMHIRKRMIALNELKPGGLSRRVWASTLTQAIHVDGVAGFDFFQLHYDVNKRVILETFIREVSNNVMHITLSWTLVKDPDGSHLGMLSNAYENALELCESGDVLPPEEIETVQVRLKFWLGRLYFISGRESMLDKAIDLWQGLVHGFLREPSTKHLDIQLAILTHLCSAYTQKLLKHPKSLEAGDIVNKVAVLHAMVAALQKVSGFTQDPIIIKHRFRVSLCLARIYMAQDDAAKARDVLHEHAVLAFALLSQRNNKPLSSIGWLYLASILTILGRERRWVDWAWSKVKLHQPMRWKSVDPYPRNSNLGPNPPLDAALKSKLEAIKVSEEYTYFDGVHRDNIGQIWPDDHHLPSFTTMVCDGRSCRGKDNNVFENSRFSCEPLQIAEELWLGEAFEKERGHHDTRKPYRVCRDCMLSKMCETCYTRLEKGTLPPMGCMWDHDAYIIPGSNEGVSYLVTDEDMVRVEEESKVWGVDFDWRV